MSLKTRNSRPISIIKTETLTVGANLGKIEDIELVVNKEINYYGKKAIEDVLKVTVDINGIRKTKDMIFRMSENSMLGKLIKAIRGKIPQRITNLEEELVGKEVMVVIDTNVKDNRTYYNIVGFESVEYEEEYEDDDEDYTEDDRVAEEGDEYEDDEYESEEDDDDECESDEDSEEEYDYEDDLGVDSLL